ncbi:hypothetical protein COW46_00015 [Candidatus Gracilibacteria bacterium CG17_big_fil_post_rev_8_21_14_2_50_48_13]|nr:MAG: hypothetical protein COW46_00015 [Candidatus Gracilibacteria bacterium CG17_big_fil_post_rev_8_21_14_2_50_48_13]
MESHTPKEGETPNMGSYRARRERLKQERKVSRRLRKAASSALKQTVQHGKHALGTVQDVALDAKEKITRALDTRATSKETAKKVQDARYAAYLQAEGFVQGVPEEEQVFYAEEVKLPPEKKKLTLFVDDMKKEQETAKKKIARTKSAFTRKMLALGTAGTVAGAGLLMSLPQVRSTSDVGMRQQLAARESAWDHFEHDLSDAYYQVSMTSTFQDLVQVEQNAETGEYTLSLLDPKYQLVGEYALADRGTAGYAPIAYTPGSSITMGRISEKLWPYHAFSVVDRNTGAPVKNAYAVFLNNIR